jgi:Domain of Unknown Function (DUF913)
VLVASICQRMYVESWRRCGGFDLDSSCAGVLPDAATIQSVLPVIEALCLSARGRRFVAAAQPLRCLVPLLTQATYATCDSTAATPLVATNVCTALDDLVRHLPPDLAQHAYDAAAAAMRVLIALGRGCDAAPLTWQPRPRADPYGAVATDDAAAVGAAVRAVIMEGVDDGSAGSSGEGGENAKDETTHAGGDEAPAFGAAGEGAEAAATPASDEVARDAQPADTAPAQHASAGAEAAPAGGSSAAPGDAPMSHAAALEAALNGTASGDDGAAQAAGEDAAPPADTSAVAAGAERPSDGAAADDGSGAAPMDVDAPEATGLPDGYSERQAGWLPGLAKGGAVLEWSHLAAAPAPLHGVMLHNAVAVLDLLLSLSASRNASFEEQVHCRPFLICSVLCGTKVAFSLVSTEVASTLWVKAAA